MKLINILPIRNEDWIIGLTVRAMLQWADHLVIGLHCCTDNTVQILAQIEDEVGPDRMSYAMFGDDSWHEMAMRQHLLMCARLLNPTHISILDADEILTGNMLDMDQEYRAFESMIASFPPEAFPLPQHLQWRRPHIRNLIANTPAGHILQLPGYNLRNGISQYHANGIWSNRWFSAAFVDDPRLGWTGDRFHAREPQGIPLKPWRPTQQGAGGILHLWGASERLLLAKHRMYKIVEALRYPNKDRRAIEREYNQATHNTGWQFKPVPDEWWEPYRGAGVPWLNMLDLEAIPWQEAWVDAQIAKHGRERFAGLTV